MNLLILKPEDLLPGNRAKVSGHEAQQLREVIKLPVGESCKAGLLNGQTGTAKLLEYSPDGSALLEYDLQQSPPPPLEITLVCAMQRPNTFDKILHTATVMGVKKFCFIGSRKVEKSYWQSSVLKEEHIRQELILALEQAADTILPEISCYLHFKPFAEDVLPQLLAERPGVCAHPGGLRKIGDFSGHAATLIVGPEGGFTDYEVGKLAEAGAQSYSMGRRILRSEFAVTALLAQLGPKCVL